MTYSCACFEPKKVLQEDKWFQKTDIFYDYCKRWWKFKAVTVRLYESFNLKNDYMGTTSYHC